MLRNPLLVPDLRELLQAGETEGLRDFFGDQHPAHVAEMIVTSIAIPPVSLYWRVRGALHFRVFFL